MTDHLHNCPRTVQDKFNALPEGEQRRIERAVERHEKACAKSGLGVDKNFIEEMVREVEAGR